MKKRSTCLIMLLCATLTIFAQDRLKNEFRATWLASVIGIDWPKTKVSTAADIETQKKELTDIFDKLQAGNMNAVCFQVRARSDAFYKSSYEPWAAELTGSRGKDPGYDPLAFAIEEAHKRGMELHAWVNPFRVSNSAESKLTAAQIEEQYTAPEGKMSLQPTWVIEYEKGQIIDPGYPKARAYVVDVIMDIVNNYDVDGLVMDDYFYAYGGTKNEDAASQKLYFNPSDVVDQNKDGKTLDDWRRSNVDDVIQSLYNQIQTAKPWVRFGMGPGGVWTNKSAVYSAYGLSQPSTTKNAGDPYTELYCNTVEWIKNGWVDYVNPQIYWSTTASVANYTKLCEWWAKVCEDYSEKLGDKTVHFFPSMAAYKVYGSWNSTSQQITPYSGFPLDDPEEMKNQVDVNRMYRSSGYTGEVYYNTSSYLKMYEALAEWCYNSKALVPPMDWKVKDILVAPSDITLSDSILTWSHSTANRFTVYVYPKAIPLEIAKENPAYLKGVVYGNSYSVSGVDLNDYNVAIYSYDRYGVEHAAAVYNAANIGEEPTPEEEDITWVLYGGEIIVKAPTLSGLWSDFKTYFNQYYPEGSEEAATIKETGKPSFPRATNLAISVVSTFWPGGVDSKANIMTNSNSQLKWLGDYIQSVANAQGYTLSREFDWRWHLQAFFNCLNGTITLNDTTIIETADFTKAGLVSAWESAYLAAYQLPTSVTSTFALPTPIHPGGFAFLGWYDNASCAGTALTSIPAGYSGTLYAKWSIQKTNIITYTTYDESVVIPYDDGAFDAKIVTNIYENAVGTILFETPLTEVKKNAFRQCENLLTITLPEGLTKIGYGAFADCYYLGSIYIPNTVTKIERYAFDETDWYYRKPEGLVYANDKVLYAVKGLVVGDVVVKEGIVSISPYAFDQMVNINSITLPQSVSHIGDRAFRYCSSLESIDIPANVAEISMYTFYACKALKSISVEAEVPPTLHADAFYATSPSVCYVPCDLLGAYSESDWGSRKFRLAYKDCAPAITYELNGGITNDDGWYSKNDMFQACMKDAGIYTLSSLDILKDKGTTSFKTICSKLDSTACQAILDDPKWDWLEAYIMQVQNADADAKTLEEGVASAAWRYAIAAFFLDSQRTSWPQSADFSQAGKEEVYISAWQHGYINPSDVVSDFVLHAPYKEAHMFDGWYTDADFSDEKITVVNEDTRATLYAKWVPTYKVTTRANDMEYGTTFGDTIVREMEVITISAIPNNDHYFAQWSDGNTDNPRTIVVTSDAEFVAEFKVKAYCGDNLYWEYDSQAKTLVVKGYGDMYSYEIEGSPWSSKRNEMKNISFPEGMTSVGAGAFANHKYIDNIAIPATVERIDDSAFEDCRSMSTLTFAEPSALTTIGNWAFYNCHELKTVVIPEGVQVINHAAFYGCTYLNEVTLPESMEYISDNGFALCAKLSRMNVNATTPPMVEARTFEDVDRSIPVYVPNEAVSAYRSASVWEEFNIVGKSTTPTSVENVEATATVQKIFHNGKLYLYRNGKVYSVLGHLMEDE